MKAVPRRHGDVWVEDRPHPRWNFRREERS
jgi:hypothetical protein